MFVIKLNLFKKKKDEANIGVVWLKRGTKFSSRASGRSTDSLNTALLFITNFQPEDLGIYICRAKAINPNEINYTITGEQKYYLMASQFGMSPSEQILLNPDIEIKPICYKSENCFKPEQGEHLLLTCTINNFGKLFLNLI